jgi:hypothetical protein
VEGVIQEVLVVELVVFFQAPRPLAPERPIQLRLAQVELPELTLV